MGWPHCKEPLADCIGKIIVKNGDACGGNDEVTRSCLDLYSLYADTVFDLFGYALIGSTISSVVRTGTMTHWLLWPLSKPLVNIPSAELFFFWDDIHLLVFAKIGSEHVVSRNWVCDIWYSCLNITMWWQMGILSCLIQSEPQWYHQ